MSDHTTQIKMPLSTQKRLLPYIIVYCLAVALTWYFFPSPIIAIYISSLPLVLLIAMRSPFTLCIIFILFTFFRFHEAIPALYTLHIPQILAISVLALLFIYIFTHKIDVYWNVQLTWFTLFFLFMTVTIFFATSRELAWTYWTGTFGKIGLLVYAIVWLAPKPKEFHMAGCLIILGGILIGCIALFNKVMGIDLVEQTRVTIGHKLGSLLGDPNDLALVLLFAASFAMAYMLTPTMSLLSRSMGFVAIIIIFLAILATGSRGGLLGFLAIAGYFTYMKIPSKALFFSLAAAAVIVILANVDFSARLGTGQVGLDESAHGRLVAWKAATKMMFQHPLTGVGLDNFTANYFYYTSHWTGKPLAVHSTWFGVLAEGGIIGFILFSILVFNALLISYKSMRHYLPSVETTPIMTANSQALFSGLLGFCVAGTFLTQAFTWPFYILFSLSVALRQYIEQNKI